jgi:hypothetical protein
MNKRSNRTVLSRPSHSATLFVGRDHKQFSGTLVTFAEKKPFNVCLEFAVISDKHTLSSALFGIVKSVEDQ